MSLMVEEAIKFAIEKEYEAVEFYEDMAKDTKRDVLAKEFKKLANMERGHAAKLKNLDYGEDNFSKVPEDMKIADYMADVEYKPEMSFTDIIQLAMQRELAAKNLYEDLARLSINENVKKLFQNLSNEEAQHKNFFEKLWDEEVLKEN
ncbi:MAG: ferritin family protein [Deltaproteobacteria bacterium]|jgi:rubrerythrin|nr:ferritin family protein [Deltaproteobacteria bacterium]